MKAGDLFKILQDNFSSGTLDPTDDIIVIHDGYTMTIVSAECDTPVSYTHLRAHETG
jgi:hypothetical protein